MTDFILQKIMMVPRKIRNKILQNGMIDKANTIVDVDGSFEYLFDAYSQFIDVSKEHSDPTCPICRDYVLREWKQFKPYMERLKLEDA